MAQKRKIKRTHKVKTKKNKKFNRQKTVNLVLSFLVISLITTIASYFFLPNNVKSNDSNNNLISNIQQEYKQYNKNKQETPTYEEKAPFITEKFEEYTKELEQDYTNVEEIKQDIINIIKNTKKIEPIVTQKIEEIKEVIIPKEQAKIEIINNKPKLAIIIDDVTLQSQVNNIQKINHNITMSFMPPIKTHKNSAKIAQDLDFYMVHFPMQATSFKFEETHTLHIGDSYEKIEKRVKKVREWYPNAKYTNNHTGSRFTAHDESMDYFYRALKKYNFIFLDSRTTPKTVSKKYAKKYDLPFLARNIFLDNKQDYQYILGQLKKSIKIAKKSGYAIAIGHPHKITLKVLKEAEPLFKDLNLVYVNKIPHTNP